MRSIPGPADGGQGHLGGLERLLGGGDRPDRLGGLALATDGVHAKREGTADGDEREERDGGPSLRLPAG